MSEPVVHVAIDGRELLGHATGVGRYLSEIVRAWSMHNLRFRLTFVAHADPPAAVRSLTAGHDWITEPDATGGTRWEQMRLPRVLARLRPDVLFAPGYTAPLRCPCPFVVAIYDVSFWAHPEWFGRREGLRRRWLVRAAARRAARIVTISQFSRDEIRKYLRVPDERIVIAQPGAPALSPHTAAGRSPLVLYVGSLFNRRHIREMIEAFALVANTVPSSRFVLVGDNRTFPRIDPRAIAAAAGVGDRVEWREYVDDAELTQLYDSARVFLFLSAYEGFGMTPLEAIAHGAAPVVLDSPISHEVLGDAALAVPLDPQAIADGLHQLLTNDGVRQDLVARGPARLAAYSWPRSAATIARALRDACS